MASQEIKNRKLLEMLEEQKKRLRGVGSLDVSSSMSSTLGLRQVAPASVVNFNNNGTVGVVAGNSLSQSFGCTPSLNNKYEENSDTKLASDVVGMTPTQRMSLQFANANSDGYFIPQDSSFGNLILPVLPRLLCWEDQIQSGTVIKSCLFQIAGNDVPVLVLNNEPVSNSIPA